MIYGNNGFNVQSHVHFKGHYPHNVEKSNIFCDILEICNICIKEKLYKSILSVIFCKKYVCTKIQKQKIVIICY